MKKYFLISLLVLSLGLFSCSDDSTSPSSTDTMPLKIGNSWTYDGYYIDKEIDPITVKITNYGAYDVQNKEYDEVTVNGYYFEADKAFTFSGMIVVENATNYEFYLNISGIIATYEMTIEKGFEGYVSGNRYSYEFELGSGIIKINNMRGYDVDLIKKSLKQQVKAGEKGQSLRN